MQTARCAASPFSAHPHTTGGDSYEGDGSGIRGGQAVWGSSGVFRICGEEREEVSGDLPEDGDDEPGWQARVQVVEFGRELGSDFPGLGDEGGSDALAEGAEGLAHDLGV